MVEHLLAKEKVAGSNPVFRSANRPGHARAGFSLPGLVTGMQHLMPSGRGGTADAAVLKTVGAQAPCGFESRRPHLVFRMREPKPKVKPSASSLGSAFVDHFSDHFFRCGWLAVHAYPLVPVFTRAAIRRTGSRFTSGNRWV